MSFELAAQVHELDLDSVTKHVLLKLADNASDTDHSCFPSVGYIQHYTGLSRSTVKRRLQKLTDNGIVSVVKRKKANGHDTSNKYFLDFTNAKKLSKYKSEVICDTPAIIECELPKADDIDQLYAESPQIGGVHTEQVGGSHRTPNQSGLTNHLSNIKHKTTKRIFNASEFLNVQELFLSIWNSKLVRTSTNKTKAWKAWLNICKTTQQDITQLASEIIFDIESKSALNLFAPRQGLASYLNDRMFEVEVPSVSDIPVTARERKSNNMRKALASMGISKLTVTTAGGEPKEKEINGSDFVSLAGTIEKPNTAGFLGLSTIESPQTDLTCFEFPVTEEPRCTDLVGFAAPTEAPKITNDGAAGFAMFKQKRGSVNLGRKRTS